MSRTRRNSSDQPRAPRREASSSALRRTIGRACSLLCAASALFVASCAVEESQPAAYRVAPGKDDVEVTSRVDGGEVTFEVRSPSGIGSAQAIQTGGGVPTSLRIRLHLKGLEQFTFQHSGTTVVVAISSHDGSLRESVSVKSGAEQAIGPDSPYWLATKIVSVDPTIPLKDGFFEVLASRHFLASASREFTLRWVDFYR